MGTRDTKAEFRDIIVQTGDKTLFQSRFANNLDGWQSTGGEWAMNSGILTQNSRAINCRLITGDNTWSQQLQRTVDWFLGDNDLQIALYDPTTGGCRDSLHPERVNENQGAESTLAFLMAQVEMRLLGEVDGPRSSRDVVSASNNKNEVTADVL